MSRKKISKLIRERLLIETTAQIKRLRPEYSDYSNKLNSKYLTFTSFLVLYEFKIGFIRTLINFYFRVKISESPAKAISSWSESYKIRELKNEIILEAMIANIFGSIHTEDKDKYLRQIEGVIWYLLSSFKSGIISFVGDFGSNEIVKFKITSSDNYQNFLNLCNENEIIALDKFWLKYKKELKLLSGGKSEFNKNKKLRKVYEALNKIESDLSNANKPTINKIVMDAAIAVDCPPKLKILTSDDLFRILCPLVGRGLLLFDKAL